MEILIVEDSNTQAELLRRILVKEGHSVLVAGCGKKALELLNRYKPMIVISDVVMPGMNGYELCRHMKDDVNLKGIFIILLTSLSDPKDVIKGLECGADGFVVKPYDKEHLLSCVSNVLTNTELCTGDEPAGIEIYFAGQKYFIASDRRHILNFLLFTYKTAVQKNFKLIETQHELVSLNKKLAETVQNLVQTSELAEKQRIALDESNKMLAQKVAEAVEESHQKDMVMMRQSRFAEMGEMIGNIAHQWRQPLNALNLLLSNVQDAYEYNELDKEYLYQRISKGKHLIRKMSTTIDDFRNFFRPDKDKEEFALNQAVEDVLSLVDASFKYHNIAVRVEKREEICIAGFPNEYSQVILNILNNAKDAIVENKIKNGVILIDIFKENDRGVVTIRDNGGGISDGILDKIFNIYFTTKDEGSGTGLGLYLSRVIIEEHMGGKIEVKNVGEGAEFKIITPGICAGKQEKEGC